MAPTAPFRKIFVAAAVSLALLVTSASISSGLPALRDPSSQNAYQDRRRARRRKPGNPRSPSARSISTSGRKATRKRRRRSSSGTTSISTSLIFCHDKHISAFVTQRHGPVSKDDAVEIFVSPNPDKVTNYYTFEINAIGAMLNRCKTDWWHGGSTWDPEGVVYRTTFQGQPKKEESPDDDHWSVELAIPLSNFSHDAVHTPPQAGRPMAAESDAHRRNHECPGKYVVTFVAGPGFSHAFRIRLGAICELVITRKFGNRAPSSEKHTALHDPPAFRRLRYNPRHV